MARPAAPSPTGLEQVLVETPAGPARVHLARVSRPRALVVLGHGAGRGIDTADLLGLARDLPGEGVAVALVDQPWVVAGRRLAVAPPALDEAWRAVVPGLRALAGTGRRTPLVVGGRSAGARVACRTAVDVGAAAVLALAFPLVPPGQDPATARDRRRPELAAPAAGGLPLVVAQGARDGFGTPARVRGALRGVPGAVVRSIPDADHALRVRAGGPDPARALLAAALEAVAAARGE